MSAREGYRLWLARRMEEGTDLDRVRVTLEAWRVRVPEGLSLSDVDAMLADLGGANPAPPAPSVEAGAFD